MDGSERIIQSLRFAQEAIEVTWLNRGEIRGEGGRSYVVHSINFTRSEHPEVVAHFEYQADLLLGSAIDAWRASEPTIKVPNSQTALRAALRYRTSVAPLLTPSEQKILTRLVAGDSVTQMSGRLGKSHGTIKNHVTSLYRKLGVHNQASAVVAAIRQGLVPPE